jgi:hypothetical protein
MDRERDPISGARSSSRQISLTWSATPAHELEAAELEPANAMLPPLFFGPR